VILRDPLEVVDGMPEGAPAFDLPPQPAVFAPDVVPGEIAEIAARLRQAAGLPKEPSGVVAEQPSRRRASAGTARTAAATTRASARSRSPRASS
jgi:hypothetical protein